MSLETKTSQHHLYLVCASYLHKLCNILINNNSSVLYISSQVLWLLRLKNWNVNKVFSLSSSCFASLATCLLCLGSLFLAQSLLNWLRDVRPARLRGKSASNPSLFDSEAMRDTINQPGSQLSSGLPCAVQWRRWLILTLSLSSPQAYDEWSPLIDGLLQSLAALLSTQLHYTTQYIPLSSLLSYRQQNFTKTKLSFTKHKKISLMIRNLQISKLIRPRFSFWI